MNIWNILKIDKTKDKSLIKSAYYNILTSVNPEDNPEDFKNLRTAYEEAIKYTETNETNDIKKNTSLDLWLEKVKNIYDNFSLRIDVKKWTEILNADVCISLDTNSEACEKLLLFLSENINIPHSIWSLIESYFNIKENKNELYEKFQSKYIDYIIYKIDHEDILNYYLFKIECNKDYDTWIYLYFETREYLNNNNIEKIKENLIKIKELKIYHPYLELLEARCFINFGDLINSRKICSKLIKEYPNDLLIVYTMAEIEWAEKNYEIAENLYKRCLNISPDNLNCKLGLADVWLEEGKLEKSKELFIDLIDVDKYDNYIRNRLSYINQILIIRLENLVKKNPYDDALKIQLAWCYYENSKYKEAIKIIINLHSNDQYTTIQKNILLGSSYFEMKDYDIALSYYYLLIENFSEIIDKSELANIYNKIGRTYTKTKKYEDAIYFYNKTLYINKDNIYYINCKCDVLIKLGKYKECFELTEEGLKICSNDSLIYDYRAESLFNLGLLKEAFDCANTSIKIYPYYSNPYLIKIKVLLEYNENEKVIEIIDYVNKLEIHDNEIMLYKARALRNLNKSEEAERTIKSLLLNLQENTPELDFIKSKAFYELAISELNKENFNSALELINEAICLDKNDLDNYYLRAYIYKCCYQYELSLNDYFHLLNNNGNIEFIYFNCACIYKEMGEFKIAKVYLNKLLKINPNYPNAKEELLKLT